MSVTGVTSLPCITDCVDGDAASQFWQSSCIWRRLSTQLSMHSCH